MIANVAVLTEGYDNPPTSCVVLLRPSSYKSTMIQMVGRGLRTVDPEEYPGVIKTDCVILDFGTSSLIHGSLEQDVDLDGRLATGDAPTKQCPECAATVPAAVIECPLCGYVWECKTMNARNWRACVKDGVAVSKPVYAAQIALYQAYMDASVPGLAANPALFTAINKDTAELHHELVPFNTELAQRMSDRAVRVLSATDAGELLPRIARDRDHFECRMCAYANRCWSLPQ